MRRVAIVGCGGSGKSFLARELGRRSGLPVFHLDTLFYDEHWNALPQDEFAAAQRELVARERWIVDGNYRATLQVRLGRAEVVVFVDPPTLVCLWGVLSRSYRHGKGQRRAEGVFVRLTPGFVRYVLTYRRRMRPRVLEEIRRHLPADAAFVHLRGRRAVRDWLATIPGPAAHEPAA